jgi:membrane protease YdiL (CAAX protease family)
LVASAVAAILGFLLGIIMVMHQSIWPAVIAHGMFDATSFALVPVVLGHIQRAR